jgi:hypothetical protein
MKGGTWVIENGKRVAYVHVLGADGKKTLTKVSTNTPKPATKPPKVEEK